jgi:ribonucleoside-diphosphate reductase alpha chain
MLLVNPLFEHIARKRGFYSNYLMEKIKSLISIQSVKEIPKDVRDLFITAFDIKPEMHVQMQAAFQKYTDNAVSKTVNLNPTATVADVRNIYLLAYQLKCKGITIFRLGSKHEQVMGL